VTATTDFRFRSVVLPALAPTLLFSIGEGAILPIIPAVAADKGADLAGAGLVAAMILVGNLLGDIPSGALIARIGERRAMIGASAVSVVGVGLAYVAPTVWVLGAGILLVGLATAIFALARHAFMTTFVPRAYRARALSTVGGVFRLGAFIGPFVTAAIIHLTGISEYAFVVHLVACASVTVLLIALPDPTERIAALRANAATDDDAGPRALFPTIWANRRIHATIGLGAMAIAALRASRTLVLPLWAVSIGIDEGRTALIIGFAGAIDVALFYAGGWIMDRFGRLWTAVPSAIGLSLAFGVLSLTHDRVDAVGWFIGVAALLALANGIGAGILMTIGADLADPRHPATFLGAWRFQTDAGGASASLLIAGITAVISLPVAVATMGAIGLVGAGLLVRFVPRRPT
jgi:MFS family permease